jgi:hypothetical protein
MTPLRCTLVSDGSSDRVLIPILSWLLRQYVAGPGASIEWFDPSVPGKRARTLAEKLKQAMEFYPCQLLFVHRDSESEPYDRREEEIDSAWASLHSQSLLVRVIPVRMTETWLLFDEESIRRAAHHPKGKVPLNLPRLVASEGLADPKDRLHQALRTASEKSGRQLKKFVPEVAVHRLAELVTDYSPLRQLPAFQRLEAEIEAALRSHGHSPKQSNLPS